uniref:G_PROTEIN_RECEP_F1_2 domain-containing protein n=1 Tax=Panagrellus redivivus TaxID=6233 RepID=A0A7E4VIW2_PANRE
MNRFLLPRFDDGDMYSCSRYTAEEWDSFRNPNLFIGLFYICSGIIYDVLYLPVLAVMTQPKFRHRSCYRIMLYLGVIDFTCVIINSIISGYFSIVGSVYCTRPMLTYIAGCISTGK